MGPGSGKGKAGVSVCGWTLMAITGTLVIGTVIAAFSRREDEEALPFVIVIGLVAWGLMALGRWVVFL